MSLLQDRHVLILGLGLSGLAMARWCAAQGASVTVADTRAAPPQLEALRAQVPAARFVAGPMDAALVDDASLRAVYRSPGLAPAAISSVVNAARERGLPVSGELGLFAQALADLKAQRGYAPAVLAITGTNGKTTVTALTGQLVERAGLSVVVAGNIGPTLLETLQAHLADDSLPQAWVLELSSFQLDGSDDFEPTAATVLNVTQDHLDWHGDMAAYAAAKARIFGERAVMVLNRNDDAVMAMRPAAPAKLPKGAPRPVPRSVVSFGADMPAEPGDFGIEVVGGMAWLVRAQEADETLRRRKDVEVELHIQRLMPADALRCASAVATTPSTRWPRWRWPPARAASWGRCCTACANTAASRTASNPSGCWTASSTSTTARAPTWAPPWPRWRAWAPSASWW